MSDLVAFLPIFLLLFNQRARQTGNFRLGETRLLCFNINMAVVESSPTFVSRRSTMFQ